MSQQEQMYLHDVTNLLKEAVDLLEIASPWHESRKWFARLLRVKKSARELQPPIYVGKPEDLDSLHLSIPKSKKGARP
jgi:hypothetical protein